MARRADRKASRFQIGIYYFVLAVVLLVSVSALMIRGFETFVIVAFCGGAISIAAGYVLGVSRFNR
jgi:hypothetical protein